MRGEVKIWQKYDIMTPKQIADKVWRVRSNFTKVWLKLARHSDDKNKLIKVWNILDNKSKRLPTDRMTKREIIFGIHSSIKDK